MKKKINKLKVLLQSLAMVSIVGFYSIAQAVIVVELRVNSDESKLTIDTHGTCARQPNNNGCMRVSGRQQISFNLAGDRKCTEVEHGRWELDHVALGNSEGGAPGNISAVAASDFNADQGSGLVTPLYQNANLIKVQDHNTEAYDIWYTVVARCAGGSSEINSDPRVENDGTGRN